MDKQIEALAKELDYCETHDCIGESCAKCRAIWLIENGYRKIDENSVVLTQEEFDEFREDSAKVKFLKKQIEKQAVKEVLEKINEKLCTFKLENKSKEFTDGYTEAIAEVCGRLDEIAKYYKS